MYSILILIYVSTLSNFFYISLLHFVNRKQNTRITVLETTAHLRSLHSCHLWPQAALRTTGRSCLPLHEEVQSYPLTPEKYPAKLATLGTALRATTLARSDTRPDPLENCHLNIKKLTFFSKKLPKIVIFRQQTWDKNNWELKSQQYRIYLDL